MSGFIPGSTGNVYYDEDDNPCALHQMVKRSNEWACSRIREGEKAAARVNELEEATKQLLNELASGDASDGYHTHNELYEFRKIYNAALFNEWGRMRKYCVHKSLRHYDGELCFGGGWFIVVALLPTGQISNHYKVEDWDLFKIRKSDTAWFEFDGHTSRDVAARLEAFIKESGE